MSDEWDFYPLRVDDQPASIFVNLSLAKMAPISGKPHMSYISIRMRQPREDGLSSQEEFQALGDLEDLIVEAATENADPIYVGRDTTGGDRDFFFYTSDPVRFVDTVTTKM